MEENIITIKLKFNDRAIDYLNNNNFELKEISLPDTTQNFLDEIMLRNQKMLLEGLGCKEVCDKYIDDLARGFLISEISRQLSKKTYTKIGKELALRDIRQENTEEKQ